jgi:hypothetical protein
MSENDKKTSEFDYFELWEKQDKKEAVKLEKELPNGRPRKGIKGKYIKPKGYVSKRKRVKKILFIYYTF